MQAARTALVVLSWTFLAVLAVQVFLAGVGLFGAGSMATHRDIGYLVPVVPLLMVIAAAVARARQLVWLSGVLFVLSFVQGVLPLLRDGMPYVAALHPVNALALFWLGLTIARRATELARTPPGTVEAATAQ